MNRKTTNNHFLERAGIEKNSDENYSLGCNLMRKAEGTNLSYGFYLNERGINTFTFNQNPLFLDHKGTLFGY